MLPLNDYRRDGIHSLEYKVAPPESGRYVYYPGTTEVPEARRPGRSAASFKILAEVDSPRHAGLISSQGSRFGGYSMFVKDGELRFVYNFLGIPPEQSSAAPRPGTGKHIVGVEFAKRRSARSTKPGHDDPLRRRQAGCDGGFPHPNRALRLAGEGLAVGYDSGDPVTTDYGRLRVQPADAS